MVRRVWTTTLPGCESTVTEYDPNGPVPDVASGAEITLNPGGVLTTKVSSRVPSGKSLTASRRDESDANDGVSRKLGVTGTLRLSPSGRPKCSAVPRALMETGCSGSSRLPAERPVGPGA